MSWELVFGIPSVWMILSVNSWVISENDRTILSAHCFGHKAGLAESCSNIASVLFYFEATTRIQGKRRQARLHTGKMLMDFYDICMRGLSTSIFHQLRSSKKSSTRKSRIYNSRKSRTIQQLLVLSRRMHVIYLLNIRTATWNLFVLYNKETNYYSFFYFKTR